MSNTASAKKDIRQNKKRKTLNLKYKNKIKEAEKSKDLKKIYQEFELLLQKYKTKVYLTKDSFMSKKYFKNAYKNLNKFKEIKEKYDPLKLINSFQSQRLGF